MPSIASKTIKNDLPSKPVTMAEMARLAGVHSRTVSDVLKGTGRVAPATREKVLRIAQELNYVPNAAARALATGRTGIVAVMTGPLNESFYANMVHHLESHLTMNGYGMTLLHSQRDVQELLKATQPSLVDGVIVIGSNHFPEEFIRSRNSNVQACVVIDTSRPNFVDHISLDLGEAVREALQLMLDMGHQRIAYAVNNRNDTADSEIRMRTYLAVLAKAGRPTEFIDVDTSTDSEERIQAIKSYIEANGCPDALLCQNDETAIYAYRAVIGLGLRLPDDVALVGCDGLPYIEFFDPPLSTIALPTEEICACVAQFLQNRLADPELPLQEATFAGQLVVRRSLVAGATHPTPHARTARVSPSPSEREGGVQH